MAYVRFALRRAGPVRPDVARRPARHATIPSCAAAGREPFSILDRMRGARARRRAGTARSRGGAAIAAWSIVHGFARLAIDGAFGTGPDDDERAAEELLPRVLDHLRV